MASRFSLALAEALATRLDGIAPPPFRVRVERGRAWLSGGDRDEAWVAIYHRDTLEGASGISAVTDAEAEASGGDAGAARPTRATGGGSRSARAPPPTPS